MKISQKQFIDNSRVWNCKRVQIQNEFGVFGSPPMGLGGGIHIEDLVWVSQKKIRLVLEKNSVEPK